MAKKLIDILRVFARELIELEYDVDYALKKISIHDMDFMAITDDLLELEITNAIDELELDTIRMLLAYILIKDTDIDIELIYSFVFSRGRQIIWN